MPSDDDDDDDDDVDDDDDDGDDDGDDNGDDDDGDDDDGDDDDDDDDDKDMYAPANVSRPPRKVSTNPQLASFAASSILSSLTCSVPTPP